MKTNNSALMQFLLVTLVPFVITVAYSLISRNFLVHHKRVMAVCATVLLYSNDRLQFEIIAESFRGRI